MEPTVTADPSLDSRFARLIALRAAWGVLSPSGLTERGLTISESGRSITDRIKQLKESQDECSQEDLKGLDQRLSEFESSMRGVAAEISVAQLRSTLPNFLVNDRPGLLDLLDVLIGSDPTEFEKATDRIGAIDYLMTLLCTSGESSDGAIRHDPVTLTPRVEAVCQRAEEASGAQFPEVEAEFFAASTMSGEDLREEFALRTLRSRKAELGPAFFVPRILRAVVTYNAVLLDRVAAEILDSGDWGFVGNFGTESAATDESSTSVFAGESLRAIAQSIRLRAADEKAQSTPGDPISQIAWALDFDYLAPNELKALLGPDVATEEDVLGTAILVGLLCRSLAVLSVELQAVGISPDDVSDYWTLELSSIFQEQINQSISKDAYKVACALSELKNKFLSAPVADQFRQQKEIANPSPATIPKRPVPPPKRKESTARDLVMDALDASRTDSAQRKNNLSVSEIPWLRIAQVAIAVGMFIFAGSFFFGSAQDLDRWSSEELESVSPFLSRGGRNQAGQGPAFVGRVDEEWIDLSASDRLEAADQLVDRLRERGLSQIMIYDRNKELRIQAIGLQSIRVL